LCGGTHVKSTGEIGFFKITSESAIAAGIRRIEGITSEKAEEFINSEIEILKEIRVQFKNTKDIQKSVQDLFDENNLLKKQIQEFNKEKAGSVKKELLGKVQALAGINLIAEKIEVGNFADIKDMAYQIKQEVDNLVLILGAELDGKANLTVMISENLIKEKSLDAVKIIREVSKEIDGGGGGQAFYATAGGKNPAGIKLAIGKAVEMITNGKTVTIIMPMGFYDKKIKKTKTDIEIETKKENIDF